MKKAVIFFALCFLGMHLFAQCEKTVSYFSGKAQFMDNAGKVVRSDNGKGVVKVSKTHIMMTITTH